MHHFQFKKNGLMPILDFVKTTDHSNMKTILITGNSGYIGSHLTKCLSQEFKIIGLDLAQPKAKVWEHFNSDIRNFVGLPKYEIDTVIHLAARVKVNESVLDPINYYSTNLNGTLNLLEKVKCNNFIFASTGSAEYCNNPYGVSKRAAEDCVKQFCQTHNIPFTIFRFYNVIGSSGFSPTNPDGLFYNLIKAVDIGKFTIFGYDYNTEDGTAVRDYVHVDEICSAIINAIDAPALTTENLGHGKGYTVKQIAELFQEINNVKFTINYGPRRAGDLERSVLDNPSLYLPKTYSIQNLLHIPKTIV